MAPSHADEVLALVHQGWEHLELHRPLAAWASWQRALRLAPEDAAAQQAIGVLSSATELPQAARTVYRFRMPADAERRARWNETLKGLDEQALDGAADAFRSLTDADPADSDAWYNLGLCLAWKGANVAAIQALERVVQLDADAPRGAGIEAWTLAEVLRQGAGAEHLADDLSYSIKVAWSDADPDPKTLGHIVEIDTPFDPELGRPQLKDTTAYEWLDRSWPATDQRLSVEQLPRLLASVIQTPRSLRLSSPDPRGLADAQEQLTAALAPEERPFRREAKPLPLPLLDAAIWTIRMPPGTDAEARRRLSRDAVEQFYENIWIHLPRHGLDDRSPLEASRTGDRVLRAKLEAVVRLREQLGQRPRTAELYAGYPFDRLRRRLGLPAMGQESFEESDTSCMNPEELDRLGAEIDPRRLAEAFASAFGLRDDERAAKFAEALVNLDPAALAQSGADLEQVFGTLVRAAMQRGFPDRALRWLDRAETLDEDLQGGSHHRSFETWRAEVLVRMGDAEQAMQVYRALLDRSPADAALALDAAATFEDRGYKAHAWPLALQALEMARRAGDEASLRKAEALVHQLQD